MGDDRSSVGGGGEANHSSSERQSKLAADFCFTMSNVTVRTRKFIRNALLARRQMIVDIIHPGLSNVSKSELGEMIAKKFRVSDSQTVTMFGFRTHFGGGKSTGFCLIYDSIEDMKKFEPKHRLVRAGLKEKVETSRKQIKEAKNKRKTIRGTGRRIANHKAKKAAK